MSTSTFSSIPTTPPSSPEAATAEGGRDVSSQRCLDCTENCPICWETYKVGEKVCWSMNEECHHAFHFDCMVNWLVDHDHCPLCRSPYLTAKKETKKRETMSHNRTSTASHTNTSTTRTRRTDNGTTRNNRTDSRRLMGTQSRTRSSRSSRTTRTR